MRTRIDKRSIKKWVAALRSGEYKQTRAVLNDENGFCCLGVACKIFVPDNKLEKEEGGFIAHELAEQQKNAPLWLKKIDNDFEKRTEVNPKDDDDDWEDGAKLSFLNDEELLSFDEIADCLELVYIHKALK